MNKEILPQSIETEVLLPSTLFTPFTIRMWLHITRVRVKPTWLDWNGCSNVMNFIGLFKAFHSTNDDCGFESYINIRNEGKFYE